MKAENLCESAENKRQLLEEEVIGMAGKERRGVHISYRNSLVPM
jgi:hypothetical protein